MNTCNVCGGPTVALFTGTHCPKDCDRRPRVQAPELTWQGRQWRYEHIPLSQVTADHRNVYVMFAGPDQCIEDATAHALMQMKKLWESERPEPGGLGQDIIDGPARFQGFTHALVFTEVKRARVHGGQVMYLVLPEEPSAQEVDEALEQLGVFGDLVTAQTVARELAGHDRAHVVHQVKPIAFYRSRKAIA